MEADAFVAEVYRRMSLRHSREFPSVGWEEAENDSRVLDAAQELAKFLPPDKHAAILDVGFGRGWFLAACLKLGYRKLSGADFGIIQKEFVKEWCPEAVSLYGIKDDIGSFLADKPQQYDFIHMSHVIEHVPKYSLLWVVDALYRALKDGGLLMLRTPNMEGPCANSCYYVTLAHEYGFSASNLASLLDICGFDDIQFHKPRFHTPSLKQRFGKLLRRPFLAESAVRHRLFGVNFAGHFDSELIVTGRRGNMAPLFDSKYR